MPDISDTPGEWWRTAVIYEVYVRSFADGNGDGVGDLIGLHERLPYLRDLGVDALWLTPFFRSPMVDGGYDVADYRDVDPAFGTLADFDTMLAAAHALGLRVLIDVVPNHTSSEHAWFQQALQEVSGSSARARYHFHPPTADGRPPNDWESVFGGPAWTQTGDGEWYLHLFDPAQPDLNWDNPDVRVEFEGVLRFWLDRGVDGFRVDVAHGMVKAAGYPAAGLTGQIGLLGRRVLPYFDQDGVHEIHRAWRKILDSYPGQRMAVAEAWASTPQRLARYTAPDELHQAFNFEFLQADWADPAAVRASIDSCLHAAESVGAPTTWVLSNHDVRRHVTRLGSPARAGAAALLMLALPGSAYVYQGDELGLPEVLDLPADARQDPVWRRSGGADPGRDGCRVPLPWAADAPAYGFSATGAAWLPQPDWAALAADAQAGDPASTLELYRRALRLRRDLRGPLRWQESAPGVLDFARDGFRCVVNLSGAAVPRPAGDIALASRPIDGDALPADTAVWIFARSSKSS
ncbi:glycoside hydrolase family 13 protein [Dactylosporangium matsuzakiense]|uniref:Alpha-glucosidase n=1 Tax=Dactylosporangium matsuzakiense TaxID=53360 RepID=A0A9W6KF09_9ACTN|nr:glycoside hydrolase family 13 protein [Dactylosporangium matsuzakiense]UWZ48908.1 glycoside hydrolase family 13 protein [Dactylosporangium matsuzakiense]GLL00871.1 alpha-glucosidase [Dactylosporangium matsuzakiense]